jgi:hypothetical protein
MLAIQHTRIPETEKEKGTLNKRETGAYKIACSEPRERERENNRDSKRVSQEFPICVL